MQTFIRILFFFLLVTQICFAQWYQQNSNSNAYLRRINFIDNNNGFIVGTSYGQAGVLLRTTNGGLNWETILSDTVPSLFDIHFIDANNGFIISSIAITGERGQYLYSLGQIISTTDGGENWFIQKEDGVSMLSIDFGDVTTGIIVGRDSVILKTTDGGLTWEEKSSGCIHGPQDISMIDPEVGFIAGYNAWGGLLGPGKLYKTTNGGNSWELVFIDSLQEHYYLNRIQFLNRNIGWAAGWESLLKTIDGGISWQTITNAQRYPFYFIDANKGWAMHGELNCKTTDGGLSWVEYPTGVSNIDFSDIYFIDENEGWAVGDNGTIIHTTNGGVTFVEDEEFIDEIPTEFLLSQNYPNPLNPSTTIKYSIPKSSQVSLKIFNTLGEELETLVDEEKSVGIYELTWNAANLPSGVYFYRLQAGDFVETKKMIILK